MAKLDKKFTSEPRFAAISELNRPEPLAALPQSAAVGRPTLENVTNLDRMKIRNIFWRSKIQQGRLYSYATAKYLGVDWFFWAKYGKLGLEVTQYIC